ncbi:hypothetical protein VFPPC_15361 [Pochonia chlamydosporia 170]|uniref:Uncharacterized protein n=1 Tax=Pochonia chlamydosporia 170 TaxID=1380566 RepID=A0A179G7K9_METCM|nr:hypothetical protein VFPPC_15361 [Pochonia chlamydosporia 170]OAQ73775.1 hypothetical protein VFPPC_15361 [Pochonia chlamydosporia 170]
MPVPLVSSTLGHPRFQVLCDVDILVAVLLRPTSSSRAVCLALCLCLLSLIDNAAHDRSPVSSGIMA